MTAPTTPQPSAPQGTIPGTAEAWETGALGEHEAHAHASTEQEAEIQAALGLPPRQQPAPGRAS